ncbi:Zinc transporter ZupT [bioreactor metagenome]|jgi:ZIP family zinc transporter|uniref:Zinc transporter ZupT n=1 Tax=bioreactor metagenome TaxID=1076179 RepID=A0A644W6X4_9ZZZZ|nr:zinc transporter ZupT [Bacteroidales bacterium]MBP6453749.1 zinc transporter ZupT [Bacteroidales bacterium]MBP8677824.1 zinc transporter ZupT [Bacteroidales bacterium]MBP9584985.1 zinc transporter ZupT [Bacteroidales bacterium]MBP9978527.1 zinc transporter ZupT [Bacteroidales bacterium]
MEGNYITAFALTLFAGLSTAIGSGIVLLYKKFSPKFLAASLGFSAGVMIFISLVELYPDAQEQLGILYGEKPGNFYTLLAFFGGIALIAIIDYLVPSYENPHEPGDLSINKINGENRDKGLMRLGFMSAFAIAIHNFPEGIATFVSAMNDPALGATIAVAIGIHNIPEGIAVAIPIYYATKSRKKAFWNSLLSGLAEPLGAVFGYFMLSYFFHESFMGVILAGVAGIMVYISLDELLPTAEKYGEHHPAIIGVIAGMAVMGLSLLIM